MVTVGPCTISYLKVKVIEKIYVNIYPLGIKVFAVGEHGVEDIEIQDKFGKVELKLKYNNGCKFETYPDVTVLYEKSNWINI